MLNNQWKMKGFHDSKGVVATENAQKPLENEGFSEYGGPLQQEMLKNHWKMKSFTDYNGVVATENAQQPMENEGFP